MAFQRRLSALAAPAAAVCLTAAAANASPSRGNDCEAVAKNERGQTVCLGVLPSSHSTVKLKSFNGSGEHGVAAVTFGLHETKVVITLKGAPHGVRQLARIRRGGCFGRSGLILGNVANGQNFAKVGPLPHVSGYSIVIHASTVQGARIVACGVIPRHHRHRG
jgi:hypothetical protein